MPRIGDVSASAAGAAGQTRLHLRPTIIMSRRAIYDVIDGTWLTPAAPPARYSVAVVSVAACVEDSGSSASILASPSPTDAQAGDELRDRAFEP